MLSQLKDQNSKKKGVIYRKDTEKKIKNLYSQWKTPTQIAKELHLLPLEVHNFIQAKEKDWVDIPMSCGKKGCEETHLDHKRCSSCDCLVHLEEQLVHTHKKVWYKMYHEIEGKIYCNWCVVGLAKKYLKNEKN